MLADCRGPREEGDYNSTSLHSTPHIPVTPASDDNATPK